MIVYFSPLALRRMKFIGAWWRKNRDAAPTLFDDELDDALDRIAKQRAEALRSRANLEGRRVGSLRRVARTAGADGTIIERSG